MQLESGYILSVIGVMAVVTYLTRSLPFLFLFRYRENRHLIYIGHLLPACAVTLLLIYCIKDSLLLPSFETVAQISAVGLTGILHLWRRNALLSVVAGTGLYMVLIRI